MNLTIAIAAALMAAFATLMVRPNGVRRLHHDEARWVAPSWFVGRSDGYSARWRFTVAIGGAALGGFLIGLPLLAVPVAGLALGVPVGVLLGRLETPASKARVREIEATLPHACDLLAACLDAGLPLRSATRVVSDAIGGPLGEELGSVATQAALGLPDSLAWRSLTNPALTRLGSDLARASDDGTVSAKNLRLHAIDATRRAHSIREESARRVGVQSVLPLMACFLPAFLLLGIVPIVGGYVSTLFG